MLTVGNLVKETFSPYFPPVKGEDVFIIIKPKFRVFVCVPSSSSGPTN